jgi:hypothetical protein
MSKYRCGVLITAPPSPYRSLKLFINLKLRGVIKALESRESKPTNHESEHFRRIPHSISHSRILSNVWLVFFISRIDVVVEIQSIQVKSRSMSRVSVGVVVFSYTCACYVDGSLELDWFLVWKGFVGK